MNCSFCEQAAQFKCSCEQLYMCPPCFGIHLASVGNHSFEKITFIQLGQSRTHQLKLNLLKRINKIELSKKQIVSAASSLITTISRLGNEAIKRLDSINKQYFKLLACQHFLESDMPAIEEIEKNEIVIQNFKVEEIKSELEKIFQVDLVSCLEKFHYRKKQFLTKNSGGFYCGALTSDGRTLVTGGIDSVIRVWDLEQNKQKFPLFGHSSEVVCLVLVEYSQSIISGSFDASVRIWSILNRNQVAVLKGHIQTVYTVCYVGQNKPLIISGDTNGELITWDFTSQTILKKFKFSKNIYCSVVMNNQVRLIAGLDKDIAIINIKNGKIKRELKGHDDSVLSICLSKDENILVSGSCDKKIMVWDLKIYKKISEFEGHSDRINSIALTLDNKFIVSGSDDFSVRIWNRETRTQVKKFYGHTDDVNFILLASENFISLSFDSGIGLLDMKNCRFKVKRLIKPFIDHSLDFRADSRLNGYGSMKKAVVWDNEKEEATNILIAHNQVLVVEVSKDCRRAIIGMKGKVKNLILWDLENNQKIADLIGHVNSVSCACFSKDGLAAASGSHDQTVRTWNQINGMEIINFLHGDTINAIKYIDNKNLLASAGLDGKLIIWDLINNTQYTILSGHNYAIYKIEITEDERFIISGDFFDGIRVWNVNEKRQEFIFKFQEEAMGWLKENQVPPEPFIKFLKV